jgi:hypothetical protein
MDNKVWHEFLWKKRKILKFLVGRRPKLLGSTCQIWPLSPVCQIKRYGEGQRKEVYIVARARSGKTELQFISSHLLGTDMSYSFRIGGRRGERGMHNYKTVLVTRGSGGSLSLALFWEGFQRNCYPKPLLLAMSSVLKRFYCSLGALLVPCYKDVIDQYCPSWNPR